MTLREIIYDIKETLNSYSDDSKLSEEHIAFIVNNKRNMLLKQYMSNLKKEIPQEAIQLICLDLSNNKNCFEEIEVLKSTVRIPPTLDNTGRSNIINGYTPLRFIKNINIIDYSRIPFISSYKYNKTQLYLAIDPKSYLIVFNTENLHLDLEKIEIEGVFENPEEAYNLSCENTSNNCDFYDAQYPIESALIDPLKNQVINELLLKYKIPFDNINDGEDNLKVSNAKTRI